MNTTNLVYCLQTAVGPCDIYLNKDEAILALLSHFDRLCYPIGTYDLQTHRYVRHEMLYEVVDESYLDGILIQHHHLQDAVAEVKDFLAESVESE